MTTGIILIAIGEYYYTQLALNLALSIKVNCPGLPVHLLHDGYGYEKLPEKYKTFFDSNCYVDSVGAFSVKTRLYDLTIFDRTLYLDVDTILLPNTNLNGLLETLAGVEFSILNTRHDKDINIWADPADIRRITGNDTAKFYHYFSELIYFEKTYLMDEYFAAVKEAYINPGIESRRIAGQIPDELAFIIASMKLGVYPHKPDWHPLFWHFRDKKDTALQMYELCKKYVGYSIGGNALPEYVKATYNNILSFYENKTRIKGLRRSEDKRILFRERSKI
jgi:hypothetical protein